MGNERKYESVFIGSGGCGGREGEGASPALKLGSLDKKEQPIMAAHLTGREQGAANNGCPRGERFEIRAGGCGTAGRYSAGGCGVSADGSRMVSLIFRRDQIFYDIQNLGYLEGHLLQGKDALDETGHVVQDICEDGNRDRVGRMLCLYYAEVMELLSPYSYSRLEEGDLFDNRLREPDVYAVELRVRSRMSWTTLQYLGRLIHEYFVCRLLEDWLMVAGLEKSVAWKAKAEEVRSAIRSHAWQCGGRGRRRCQPF